MSKSSQWTQLEVNRQRDESERLLRVVHSRLNSIRKTAEFFDHKEVAPLMRDYRGSIRKILEGLRAMPRDLGRAILKKDVIAGPEQMTLC